MKDKVTDYELCKQLHELGFDCDSYIGVWFDYGVDGQSYGLLNKFEDDSHGAPHRYKAYCSDDLLMWFEQEAPANLLFTVIQDDQVLYGYDSLDTSIDNLDPKPSNALAKAIITILRSLEEPATRAKEKKNNEK